MAGEPEQYETYPGLRAVPVNLGDLQDLRERLSFLQ